MRPLSALFLSWEAPPFVAGGSWTATFHLVRRLVTRGVDVTVATPWSAASLHPLPFLTDIPTLGLGASGGTGSSGVAESYPSSPYGPYSPYGPSPSTTLPPNWQKGGYRSLGPYDSVASVRNELAQFADRLADLPELGRFDYVHAVDWISCAAASAVARQTGLPWVAHLHSIEIERNSVEPSRAIENLERRALVEADLVVVPSAVTKAQIARRYGTRTSPVLVLANPISTTVPVVSPGGEFASNRVVFLGRLTRQKGPDLYSMIAREVAPRHPEVEFEVFGAGELADSLRAPSSSVNLRGPLPWEARHDAFSGATAVIVSSRNEPFGMVVLEAMASGVPVLYPHYAGVAEVIAAGIQIDPHDVISSANQLSPLLRDKRHWSSVVARQKDSIAAFERRGDDLKLLDALTGLTSAH
jgi:glycosyltransferase involved in cell wall biosynthesis